MFDKSVCFHAFVVGFFPKMQMLSVAGKLVNKKSDMTKFVSEKYFFSFSFFPKGPSVCQVSRGNLSGNALCRPKC